MTTTLPGRAHVSVPALLAAVVVSAAGCASGTSRAPGDEAALAGDAGTTGDADAADAAQGSGGSGTGGAAVGPSSGASGPSTHAATSTGGPSGAGGAGDGAGGSAAAPFPDPDWPTGDPAAHGFDPTLLDAAVAVAAARESTCLLVIRHGVLVSETYGRGRDADATDPSWSIAKSYSSTLVGIAIERGDIASLDTPVATYVPAWRGTEHASLTLRHVLSMTTGLEWSAFQDYVEMATFTDDQTAFALDLEQDVPPGTEWRYHNGGVQLLDAVFRGATGGTIEDYARAHLWSRIGSRATWGHDPSGNPTPYANVLATCRDHARLGHLYLHGGRWGQEQVVPESYVSLALTPSQEQNRAYGLLFWLNGNAPAEDAMSSPWDGWMVPFAPPDLFAARGFGNQFIDVIPSLDLVVVRMALDPAGGQLDLGQLVADQHFEEHDAILAAVLAALAP